MRTVLRCGFTEIPGRLCTLFGDRADRVRQQPISVRAAIASRRDHQCGSAPAAIARGLQPRLFLGLSKQRALGKPRLSWALSGDVPTIIVDKSGNNKGRVLPGARFFLNLDNVSGSVRDKLRLALVMNTYAARISVEPHLPLARPCIVSQRGRVFSKEH